ncbi:YccS family putative transporter [Haemophilus influenzae]|uniref:YccS family putative transporter n=1 Tax=Haemophilus influenzae TaxID=727 RepID=UPI000CF6A224|nr:YccS family putative transporter [Haemophilus influenzae]AVJ11169.1 integral membrane, YccS/YhfK family protein [Haemophilus influenzae]MCK8891880.1 YccS family putative transporter [Haemophilus influenzae]MCK8982744.1 YccS family putative transporter [Haemophilus influenzae]MCK9034363.1 YccS family putative transporter [Haemophilus influenzae]MCK9124373.1 YccS family putative transporter [Haemophilus influenzae]
MNIRLNAKVISTIPVFIAVNIAAVGIWFFDISSQSMPLILGIIAGGLVDLDNRLTGRLKNVFFTLIAFSISSFIVQLHIGKPIQYIVLMTVLTFIFTMIGAVGQRYSTIAFGSLVVALYTTLTYIPEVNVWFINPVMILCGTLLYSVVTLIVYLFFPNRPVQESVAKAFCALGEYLDTKSCFFDPDEVAEIEKKHLNFAMKNANVVTAFNIVRTALFYRIRGQHRHPRTQRMLRYYFAAQDIHERANSTHFDYQQITEKLKNTDLIFRIQRLLELQAQSCKEITASLRENKPYHFNERVERALLGTLHSFELYRTQHLNDQDELIDIQTLLDNLQSINWQLRQLAQDTTDTEQLAQIHTEQITGLKNISAVIFSHFTFESPLFRHAVRLSIVVFLCCAIVEFFQFNLGYWILLTTVFVCQPNYSATKVRLRQRIIGTILGVVVGSLLPYLNPTLELKQGLVVLTSTLFFFFRSNNYSFSTFFITLQVLLSFDVMGFDTAAALMPRLLDTLLGAAISWFAVSYLWPDWKYLQLDKVSHQALRSDAVYLLHIISQLQFGKSDDLKYRIARRNAHQYAAALSTTLSNMNNEPVKYKAYLQKGFDLLKLNYSLLSYISALGAYRDRMKNLQQTAQFLSGFYPVAKKIIYTLEHIEEIPEAIFNQQQESIETHLKELEKQDMTAEERAVFSLPYQQLNLITQLLPQFYGYFKKEINCERAGAL